MTSVHALVGRNDLLGGQRRGDSRQRLALASVLAILLIASAAAGSIWRYEVALNHSDVALSSRSRALRAEEATTLFWREREAMNEYLLHPSPALLEEIGDDRSAFNAQAGQLVRGDELEQQLLFLAVEANTRFLQTFAEARAVAGRGSNAELPAIRRLNAAETAVLQPLDALERVYQRQVQQRRNATTSSDSQAFAAGLVGALLAVVATGGLAIYSRRLLWKVHSSRLAEQHANDLQTEFSDRLQGARVEEEADELLKRHLERSIDSSEVAILRRNNSADRLLASTGTDPDLGERLVDAEPRSCLAIRFAHTQQQGGGVEPLVGCALCSNEGGFSTCEPLLVGGEVIGATLVRHPKQLDQPERAAIAAAVAQAGPVLANLRNLALAQYRAATDALTGMANSREVHDTLKRMAAQASRNVEPLAALMLDLDHFKQINDRHGHAAGDDALAAVGTAIQDTLRASDFSGRYGGEEFVILLPNTGREQALTVAEKIRTAISAITVQAITQPITASIGVAILPEDATDSVTLLRCADRALYAAKSNGRDRVETARPAMIQSS
jgi:diguanylate cyclase (GGDEF)-like protein